MSIALPIYRNEIPNQVPTVVKNPTALPLWAVDRAPQTVEELDQMCATPEGRKMFLMQHNQLFYAWAMGGITAAPGFANDYKGKKYHYLFQAMSEIEPIELVRKATIFGQSFNNASALGSKIMGARRLIGRTIAPPSAKGTVIGVDEPTSAGSVIGVAEPLPKPWYRRFFGGRKTKRRMMKKRKTRKMGKKGKK